MIIVINHYVFNMKNINKVINKIKDKEVKSKKQILLDQKKIEKDNKANEKLRFKQYLLLLKKYEKDFKEIKRLISVVNKKYYKKYQTNIFKECSKKDMFEIGRPILYYDIKAPYANYVTLKDGSIVKAEYPFRSTSALNTNKIELHKYGPVEVSIKEKSFFGIKYKSKTKDFRWFGPDEAYYEIHYVSGGPSPYEGEQDPDNKYIRRLTKNEILDELINLIDYHTSRL